MTTVASGRFDPATVAALSAAIGCVTAVGIGLSLSIPLMSLELERMGASGTLIGINTAVAGLSGIIVVPFVPRLAARLGVFNLLWMAVLLGTVSILLLKVLFSIAWWFPLRFTLSAALSALFVLSEYWITSAAPAHRRGLVMGVYATLLALGFAAGPALLKAVGTEGWPPYLAGAALFALASLPLLAARRLSPSLDESPKRSVRSFLFAAPAATLAALVFGAVETGGFAILPVYGVQLGYAPGDAAALVSAVAIGNVLFQIPMGMIADRVDRRLVLLAAAGAGVAGALLIPLAAGSAVGLWAVLIVWGGVGGALYTVGLAHLGARFTGADLASANAAFVLLYNIGLLLGPPVVGGAMDVVRPHGFAWSLAGFFAVYLVVVLARLRRPA
jgi:MFS family permease